MSMEIGIGMEMGGRLIAIVAMTPERVIGREGALPWHLPADLAFFKRTTSGHPIVMGRKTYESIGRPLPKRRNIVLTRDRSWTAPGVEVVGSLAEFSQLGFQGQDPVFIIGGAGVYEAFLPFLDELLVSHVHHPYPGDTFFPEFAREFGESSLVEDHEDFTVRRYLRSPSPT